MISLFSGSFGAHLKTVNSGRSLLLAFLLRCPKLSGHVLHTNCIVKCVQVCIFVWLFNFWNDVKSYAYLFPCRSSIIQDNILRAKFLFLPSQKRGKYGQNIYHWECPCQRPAFFIYFQPEKYGQRIFQFSIRQSKGNIAKATGQNISPATCIHRSVPLLSC